MVHPCLAALSFRHLHTKQARKEAQNAIIAVCYSRGKSVLAGDRQERCRRHDTMLSRAAPRHAMTILILDNGYIQNPKHRRKVWHTSLGEILS